MERAHSVRKGIAAGILAGIIGGIVMFGPMMGMMGMLNLPSDLFPKVIGMSMGKSIESASMTGMAIHFVPSVAIGLIFGAVISTSRLSITSHKKGISLGISAGIISFVVLFLPMMMTVMPPSMISLMKMMNPGATDEMIMSQMQKMQPMLLVGSLFSHIIYGLVLGVVSSVILKGRKKTALDRLQ